MSLPASLQFEHQVWLEAPDLTTVCLAGPSGDAAHALLTPDARWIHTFYAGSHFEAMTCYYAFMGWGAYQSNYETLDKMPYDFHH